MPQPTPSISRPTLGSFWLDLPREGRFLLSTVIVDFVGTGLVMPFNVAYLHEVRGFELARVGLLLSLPALVGLLVVGPVGALIDRIGPRIVVICSLLIQITAQVTLATATTELRAAVACVLLGFSGGIIWPAVQTLIGTIIPGHLRQRYFGVNFTLINLGIGIGGILGGLFVDVTRPETFVAIYLVDAATFLAPLAIFLGPLRHVPRPVKPAAHGASLDGASPGSGYRVLLRDRSLLLVLLIIFVASFVGYGQLNTGLPAFAREVGGISTQALGLAYAANTAVIVVLQLVVLQRIEGRRRTRLLMLLSAIWGASFLALGATGLVPGTVVAAFLFGLCMAVFGFGETFYQPTLPSMVNDLAPDHLRGRYNAAMSIAWQSASVVGPVMAGLLLGHGWGSAYIAMLVGGCVVVAGLALAAERRIPWYVNGVRDVEAVV
jgi:MFS family permease